MYQLAELVAAHRAVGGQRQRVDRDHAARGERRAEHPVAVRAERGFVYGVFEHDDRPHVLLAGDGRIGHAERRGPGDGRMLFEDAFDADRVDVAATAQDE